VLALGSALVWAFRGFSVSRTPVERASGHRREFNKRIGIAA
jgi:hypothetical protein